MLEESSCASGFSASCFTVVADATSGCVSPEPSVSLDGGASDPQTLACSGMASLETLQERSALGSLCLIEHALDLEGGLVPSTGDCIRIGKAQIGEITSAYKSPILGKVIALARLDVTHADEGTAVEVGQLDGMQKRLKATVVKFPHFDPTKERVKGNY